MGSLIPERQARTEQEIQLLRELQRLSRRIRRERTIIQRRRPPKNLVDYSMRFFELRSAWTLTHVRARVRHLLELLEDARQAREHNENLAEWGRMMRASALREPPEVTTLEIAPAPPPKAETPPRIPQGARKMMAHALASTFGSFLFGGVLERIVGVEPEPVDDAADTISLRCTGCGALQTMPVTGDVEDPYDIGRVSFPVCDDPPACACRRGRWEYVR